MFNKKSKKILNHKKPLFYYHNKNCVLNFKNGLIDTES